MCSSGAAKQSRTAKPTAAQQVSSSHTLPFPFPLHPSTLAEISRGSEAGRLHRRPHGPRLREAAPKEEGVAPQSRCRQNGLVVILRLLVCALGYVQRASSQQQQLHCPHHHHHLTCTLLTLRSPFTSPPHTTQAPIRSWACVPRRSSARARAGASSYSSLSSRSCLICSIEEFVLDQGKLKLDVAKTLTFLNERMRF